MRALVGEILQASSLSFKALAKVGKRNLRLQVEARKEKCVMVCGAMTSGGTGSRRYNFSIFRAVIQALQEEGLNVFDQIYYEMGIKPLVTEWKKDPRNEGYCFRILTKFYKCLFATGNITCGIFIPGWETSVGASYERKQLAQRGALIKDLSIEQIREYLLRKYSVKYTERILTALKNNEGIHSQNF